MEKGLHMKHFYSRFSITFLVFIILFSLSDCIMPDTYALIASAKENTLEEHQNLSEAYLLSPGQTEQRILSAHNTFYGAIECYHSFFIQITSNKIHKVRVTLLSDSGKKLSCKDKLTNKTKTLSYDSNSKHSSQRVFVKLYNPQTIPISFRITVTLSKHSVKNTLPKVTPEPEKKKTQDNKQITATNASSANQKQATQNPVKSPSQKKKLSTKSRENAVLYPQCIIASKNTVHKLSAKAGKKKYPLSDFTILSSNTSVAKIKNNKVYTLHSGITILYMQEKKNPANISTCLLRVLT